MIRRTTKSDESDTVFECRIVGLLALRRIQGAVPDSHPQPYTALFADVRIGDRTAPEVAEIIWKAP